MRFKAAPRKVDYVREVDYETYRQYRQKVRQEQMEREKPQVITEEDKEQAFQNFKKKKVLEYV